MAWLPPQKKTKKKQKKKRQSQLAQAPAELTCPEAEKRMRAAWKARLEAVLLEGATALTEALPAAASGGSHQAEAVLMVALGDLARYAARLARSLLAQQGGGGAGGGEEEGGMGDTAVVTAHCLAEAEAWYRRAAGARPGWGRTYNQLAILAGMQGGGGGGEATVGSLPQSLGGGGTETEAVLAAAVDYTRALLAAEEPFAGARENLVAHLDRWRRAADAAAASGGGGSWGRRRRWRRRRGRGGDDRGAFSPGRARDGGGGRRWWQ